MPELYEPPRARAAIAQARQLRARYQGAVQVIQRNGQLSKSERAQRLRVLHDAHQRAMAEQARIRQQARQEAEREARQRLMQAPGARTSRITADSYRHHLERVNGLDLKALTAEYELAELLGDEVIMQACAVTAFGLRMPDLGSRPDPASALVHRFAYAQEPDGHGGHRYRFPEVSTGWDRLRELEQWERADEMAATAVFSAPSSPEKPEDPGPPDAYDAAKADVAQLYQGNGATTAPAAGGGQG